MGPQLRVQSVERQYSIGGQLEFAAVGRAHVESLELAAVRAQGGRVALEHLHLAGAHQFAHARHGGRGGAEFGATMQQGEGTGLFAQRHRPIQSRVAAAADHQILAVKIGGRFDPIVHSPAFELLDSGQRQAPGLKGSDAPRDHHGAGREAGAAGGGHVELAALQGFDFGDFLPEMEGGMEGLRLLHEPVYQFLGTADGQRRNVVNRLVRIQLGALPTGLTQRIDDVRIDSEQAKFEDLEQSHGAGADDDGLDRRGGGLRRAGCFRHVA